MAVLVTLVAGIPGPVIGMGLILLQVVPLDVAGYVSSVIFAIVYPITVIASTLYYLWRKDMHAAETEQPAQVGVWDRVRGVLWGGHVRPGIGSAVGEPVTATDPASFIISAHP